jgi:putative ABC transport system permease protein
VSRLNILEAVKMSWGALKVNRLRSLLTMLGVIIGVATMVALISLGQAAKTKIEETVTIAGTNMVAVNTYMGYVRLTPEDGEMLLARVPTVSHMSPMVVTYVTAVVGRTKKDTMLAGAASNFLDIMTFTLSEGRYFTQYEVASRQNLAVLGATVYKHFFAGRKAAGETINIRGQVFTVIGVYKGIGSPFGHDEDNCIYIPYTTALRLLGTRYVQTLVFKARSADVAKAAKGHITRILEEKFRNAQRPQDDILRTQPFSVTSQDELLTIISAVTGAFNALLAGIAAVSLVVGGVGIMNIMLVSVTERTREIGIRKAIGARKTDILRQFLVESVILSGTGGAIGLFCGTAFARLVGMFGGLNVIVSPSSIALSFSFACVVGIFFGVYPASKAANLDPIVALRYE